MSVATGRRARRVRRALAGYALAGTVIVLSLGPLLLGMVTALTSGVAFDRSGPALRPVDWTLDNIVAVWTQSGFGRSVWITTAACLLLCVTQVPLSAAAAFVFAKVRFPGRTAVFAALLATLAVPPVLTVIPLYLALSGLGLRGTFWGIVAPFILASPYAIFLLRQFYRQLSDDMLDAARLDGASLLQIFIRIAAPLSWPVLLLVGFITVITQWNAFLWPRVIAGTAWPVVTVAVSGLSSQYDPQWPLVLAGTTLAAIPAVLAMMVFSRAFARAVR